MKIKNSAAEATSTKHIKEGPTGSENGQCRGKGCEDHESHVLQRACRPDDRGRRNKFATRYLRLARRSRRHVGIRHVAHVSLMLLVAGLGSLLAARGALVTTPMPNVSRILFVYLPTVIVSWSMAFYCFRIGRKKNVLSELVGKRWTTPARALVDLLLGFSLLVFIDGSETIYSHFSHVSSNPAVLAILPQTISENTCAWVVLASSVGFCEEVIYRGYLRTQFTGFFNSLTVGVVVQALLFGIAHGEQGIATAIRFAIYGIGFGLIAVKRRSLLAGIACHIAIDLSSGFLHQ